jgi:anthranilate synthase component 1
MLPSREEFRALAARGRLVPVHRELRGDDLTPVSAFLRVDDGAHAFLLESLEGGEHWGRFSMLGSRPALVFVARGDACEIHQHGAVRAGEHPPARQLAALLAARQAVALPGLPRFCGGAVGYLGLGAARWFVPSLPVREAPLPDAVFLFSDVVTVFDHLAHSVRVVTHAAAGDDPDAAWAAAAARIEAEIARLRAPLAGVEPDPGEPPTEPAVASAPEAERAFARAGEYLADGDVLRLALTRTRGVAVRRPAFETYRALRRTCPSPYLHFLRCGDLCLAGSADGTLLRRTGDLLEAQVLEGRRPRGRGDSEDQRLEQELRDDDAAGAAHALLVDVARSDLGWVAEPGTVETPVFRQVERRSRAIHLVSCVRARVRSGVGPLEVVGARFPSAGRSGVPRRRALEILARLGAPVGHGAAAFGYFDQRGHVELCDADRTLTFADGRAGWEATTTLTPWSAGGTGGAPGGDPDQALLQALQRAERGAP